MKIINIVTALALGLLAGCGVNSSPGEGQKVGQIVKVSRIGLLSKTWEGEIVRGGFQGGAGVNGQAFDFTIESEEMAHQVQAYMDQQTEVVITYRSEGVYSAFRTENCGHFLVSIKPAK